MNSRWTVALSVLATLATSGNAFVFVNHSPIVSPVTKSTALLMGPPADPSLPMTEQYGEGSRKYRRTVYNHDLWVKHRSPDRFFSNLRTLVNSGIYKQVGKEVAATVGVASFVCLWNALVGGYQGFDGTMHDPIIHNAFFQVVGLPMIPFTILTPSLGLLLGKNTNIIRPSSESISF